MNVRHLRPDDLRGRRWRGLVRESSEEQAERWSPERQRSDLRHAADELGLVAVEPLFYERTGSGEEEGVPELRRALEDGRRGDYQVLLVLHTSRFARNRAEAVTMKREFRRAGIVIYFVTQRIISGTYAGALTEGISEVIDEHENETRRMWIAGGMRERQLSGRWIGIVPLGYRKVLADFPDGSRAWDGAIEPDPATAPLVREVFGLAASGATLRAIATSLNLRGLRAPHGAPWSKSTLSAILRNDVYAGRFIRYRRTRTTHYYPEADGDSGRVDLGARAPAIIDEAMFSQVARLLRLRRKVGGGGLRTHSYPLSSVLRCRSCGHTMTGTTNGPARYYRCRGRFSHGTCTQGSIRAEVLEARFAAWLGSFTLPPDWRQEISRTGLDTVKSDESVRQRKLTDQLARVKKLYEWGDIEETEYRERSRSIRSEMGVIQRPQIESIEAMALALTTMGASWEAAPPETQASIPALMLRAAEVDGDHVEWVVRGELRPLLELCVPQSTSPYVGALDYTMRYSA